MGALRNGLREHAVNPDRGENQRKRREDTKQEHRETPERHRVGHELIHGRDVENGLVRIECYNFAPDRGDHGGRIGGGAHDERDRAGRKLGERFVHRHRRRGIEAVLFHVAHHAHDRAPGALLRGIGIVKADAFADWIFAGPEFSRHRLAGENNERRVLVVPGREHATLEQGNRHGPEIIR